MDRDPTRPAGTPDDVTRARPSRRRKLVPFAAGVAAAAATFLAMGSGGGRRARAPVASILGAPVAGDAESITLVRAALRGYLRAPLVLELGGLRRTIPREALGAKIDEPRLAALVREATDRDGALARAVDGGAVELPLPIVLDPRASLTAVNALKDDLDKPAEDARLDLEHRKVIAEADGRRIDVFTTLGAIEHAITTGAGRAEVSAVSVAPKVTRGDLGTVDLTATLGWFETRYATDRHHVDRTFNLRLAASRLNGKVILPGGTFDFNTVVGPRDEGHGYRVAKVIADGELVDGMGGGTCQIAGTLHAAALFAGLDVVQRTPHTRPSYYIKMGLDAAVAYPTITVKLKNPFSFPVVLKETVTGGVVRAEVLGLRRARLVTFIRKIDEVIPFPEREVRDPALPTGKKVVAQRGIPGFKVRRYRVVRDGAHAVRERTIDVYPPTMQIVHVGAGEGHGVGVVEDDHPEYVADEYLAITQSGPLQAAATGMSGMPTGMEEVRVAGETGTRGWTRKYTTLRPSSNAEPAGYDDGSDRVVAHHNGSPKHRKK